MVSMGYEVYQKDKNVFVKHGGKVQKEIPFSEIESLFKSGYRERTRCRQLRSILKKYRDVSSNKEELQKELKTKFGIDIVFFGMHIPADTRSAFPVISVHSPVSIQYRWQS